MPKKRKEESVPTVQEASAVQAEAQPPPTKAATPSAGADQQAQAQAELEKLRAELAKQEERVRELMDALARTRADFSNYRRRVEQEKEAQAKFANAMLIAELLPIVDNFERALETIPQELRFFSWLQGVDLIYQMVRAVLAKQGLTPIEAAGKPFDPNLHEAVLREGDSTDQVIVLEEMQRGYMMFGRVLRPALVKVGPKPAENAAAQAAEGAAPSSPSEGESGKAT